MKNKMLWLVSMFVILLFVVSCAPKMTDEELSAELSKLSPEEREAVMSEDSGTFAGMAKASPKLTTLRAAYKSSGLKKASGTKDTPVDATVVCGDGKVDVGEQCDDGNKLNGDGCSSTCQVEQQQQKTAVCGDGAIDGTSIPPETCEDGNFVNGDGCSSTCQIEQQQQGCTPGQYVCDSVLYVKQCNHLGEYNTPFKCADGEMCSNGNCVSSLQKPDLVVSNVTFSLVFNATSGKNDVMYNVTLKNIGTVNSGFFNTKVQPMVSGMSANFFGGTLAAGKESSTLGIYQGELICPGTHTLNVTADINWQVAESNEYNNNFWPFPVVTC